MRSLLLLLPLLLAAPQDELAAIIDKVDASLGDFKDASITFKGDDRGGWFPLKTPDGVQVRIRRTGEAILSTTCTDSEIVRGTVAIEARMGLAEARFTVRPTPEDFALGTPMPLRLRAGMPMTRESMADADFLVLPTAYPVRLFMDEPLLYYQLAPKRYFALVPNLKVVRVEPQIVLASRVLLKEPIKALAVPLLQSGYLDRRFIIDPKTHRIERMVVRLDLARGTAGTIHVSTVLERNDAGLPTKIEVRETAIQQGSFYERDPFVRVVAYDAVNKGFDFPAFDPDEPCADALLKGASTYTKALESNKDDARALASLATSRIWVKRVVMALLDSSGKFSTDERALEPLSALAELCPKDAFACLNVLALETDKGKRATLLAGGIESSDMAIARAAEELREGRFDKAIAHLAATDRVTESAAHSVRVAALVRGGKVADAVALLSKDRLGAFRLLSDDEVGALEKVALASGPVSAQLALSERLVGEPARCTRLLEVALDRELTAEQREEAAARAYRVKAQGLAAKLGGTAYGACLAGKPADAFRLIEKLPVSPERTELAADIATALGKEGDHELTLRACRLFFQHRAIDTSTDFQRWAGIDSPHKALATAFAARQNVVELVNALAPIDDAKFGGDLWVLAPRFVEAKVMDGFVKAATDFAAKNPKDATRIKVLWGLGRYAPDGGGNSILRAAVDAGSHEAALNLASVTTPTEAIALFRKALPAATSKARESYVGIALRVARQVGDEKAALEFARLAPASVESPSSAVWLAQEMAEAGALDEAERLVGGAEDWGLRPFVLLGRMAEKRGNWESAMRWYNRDVREGGDALVVALGTEDDRGVKKVTAADAKRELTAKLGEDFFVEILLKAQPAPMGADEEKSAKRLFEQLEGEELTLREAAEEALTKLGKTAVPIVRRGLESADEDVRSRVKGMLRKWAEPQ